MKRLHRQEEEVYRRVIDKMMEHTGKTYADMKQIEHALIEGTMWFNHYKFDTQEQYDTWKQWTINFLRTEVYPRYTKKDAGRLFGNIDLMWGLGIRKDAE